MILLKENFTKICTQFFYSTIVAVFMAALAE